MKRKIIVALLMMSAAVAIAGETTSPIIKQGALISRHIQDLAPFGDGKPLLATPAGQPGVTEVMMWRIGDGILTVTTSFSAGIVKEMSYIVRTDGGKGLPLEVKEFNPKTGEMTIRVPIGIGSPITETPSLTNVRTDRVYGGSAVSNQSLSEE